jgi:hypothetical protein
MIEIRRLPALFRMAATADGSVGLSVPSMAGKSQRARKAAPERQFESDQCTCALAPTGHVAAYNEEAFQYLLAVERKRFERSNRPFALVLVEFDHDEEHMDRIDLDASAKVFAALTRLLRETDVIGWYRHGRVIGAVLTHLGVPIADVSRHMSRRVTEGLRNNLPQPLAQRFKVRLCQPLEMLES